MSRNPLALARFEIRRFRGPLPTIALIFVLLIPLLYGAIYLVGNWDPYGRVNLLPVAVVNEDRTVDNQGDPLHAGQDFVDNLHRAGTFDFRDVDEATAEEGLRTGEYYLIIHVPADFSEALISGRGWDPRRAQIMLRRNDANGFVIGSITNSAQNSIARAIDETATRAYFAALFDNLGTIREGMVAAADGASRLDAGLTDARTGAGQLAAGAVTARDASAQLADGATQLSTGLQTARAGSAKLADGMTQLDAGGARLADGAAQVADGTQQLADTVDPVLTLAAEKLPAVEGRLRTATATAVQLSGNQAALTEAVAAMADGTAADLDALVAAHPELAKDPVIARLRQRANDAAQQSSTVAADVAAINADLQAANTALANTPSLADKATTARAKIDQLNDGAHQVSAGAATLSTNLGTASNGAQDLAAGLVTASDGAARLADGNSQLHAGLVTLADGASKLDAGLGAARDGAHELATKLTDGAKRLPDLSAADRSRTAEILSHPADVTMTVDNPAHVYGRGLAPMFFSIALWVLGISAFMLMRPVTGRVLAGRASNLRVAVSAWLPMGVISVLASWLMLGASWLGLGLDPVHPWLMILLVTLTAIAFSVFAHFLRTSVGLVATAALLVLLILQLTAAGGTYPAAILPGFFRWLHPIVPMSYSIDAFRICISGGLMEKLARDVAVLVGLTLASGLGLWLVIARKRQASMTDLHPLIAH